MLKHQALLNIIEEVGKELKWVPNSRNEYVFKARTFPGFFSGSWGEQITILFGKNEIYINSICDLQKQGSVVSMGRNRKNMRLLLNRIREASPQ